MRAETVSSALVGAAQLLAETSETPRLDAEILMAHAIGVEREVLLLRHMHQAVPSHFEELLGRRLSHEPIAYIVGWRDFWDIRLKVGPGALIPRPDSETLLEVAQAHFSTHHPKTILDLGAGPGTLLLAALSIWENATGIGVDASEAALAFAKENAIALNMNDRSEFRLGNWAEGIIDKFDLILCNPPYVEAGAEITQDVADYEPHTALFAGVDGLEDYRKVIPMLRERLHSGGLVCLEIGHEQAAPVQALLALEGFKSRVRQDLAGRDRCVWALG